jgi:PqqD family protein of HPr-rel-A system
MAGRQWRLERRSKLHWRRLDDEWVVFEAASGDTHHLDTISAAVLMCLEADPLDLDGLSEVIAGELQLPNREDLASRLEGLLDQLHRLGLIEPAAP